ncbi:hypothetical protein JOL62DRAFT_413966 [Phyllosticta paracitricarpa]|uniref:Uncharacterized protein n=2 Tax=Phyllosticta TaxID=121621 RepID=A0ABR1LX72_9PEZI
MNQLLARIRSSPRLIPQQQSHPADADALTKALELALDQPYTGPASPGALSSSEPSTHAPDPIEQQKEKMRFRQETIALENDRRKTLEDLGCLPCCPAQFEFPYEGELGKCRESVQCWKDDVGQVFSVQLQSWKRFLWERKRERPTHFTRNAITSYQNRLRFRRQRHGLQGDVHLEANVDDQTKLQDWIEYEDYQLRSLERQEKELKQVSRRYDRSLVVFYIRGVETTKARLRWIREQREIMVAEGAGSDATSEIQAEPNPTRHADQPQGRKAPNGGETARSKNNPPEESSSTRKRRPEPPHENGDPDEEEPHPRHRRLPRHKHQVKSTSANHGKHLKLRKTQ